MLDDTALDQDFIDFAEYVYKNYNFDSLSIPGLNIKDSYLANFAAIMLLANRNLDITSFYVGAKIGEIFDKYSTENFPIDKIENIFKENKEDDKQ